MASKFQNKVIKEMKAKGYKVLKTIRLSENGFPDLLCMKKDCVDIWIECKEEKDTLKELQKHQIDFLISIGKIAFCIQDNKGIIYGIDFSKE